MVGTLEQLSSCILCDVAVCMYELGIYNVFYYSFVLYILQTFSVSMLLRYSHHQIFVFIGEYG